MYPTHPIHSFYKLIGLIIYPTHPIHSFYKLIRLIIYTTHPFHSFNSSNSLTYATYLPISLSLPYQFTHFTRSSNSSNYLSTNSSDPLTPPSPNSPPRPTHSFNSFSLSLTREHTMRFMERTQETRTNLPNLKVGGGGGRC
jgi:hypothetical protein